MVKGRADWFGSTSTPERPEMAPYDPLLMEIMADPEAAMKKYWGNQHA